MVPHSHHPIVIAWNWKSKSGRFQTNQNYAAKCYPEKSTSTIATQISEFCAHVGMGLGHTWRVARSQRSPDAHRKPAKLASPRGAEVWSTQRCLGQHAKCRAQANGKCMYYCYSYLAYFHLLSLSCYPSSTNVDQKQIRMHSNTQNWGSWCCCNCIDCSCSQGDLYADSRQDRQDYDSLHRCQATNTAPVLVVEMFKYRKHQDLVAKFWQTNGFGSPSKMSVDPL